MGCTAFVVDVVAVGFVADAHDFRPQLVKHFGRDAVACAVGGIHHQFQAAQVELAGEGGFAKLDVAVVGTADPARPTQFGRRFRPHFFFQLGFDFQFYFVAQFHAAGGEEFDTVVGIRIMRGGNHHARRQTQRTGQIGHAGRGQRAGLDDVHTRRGKPRHQRGFQHIAGDSGVFTDKHRRTAFAVVMHQHPSGRIAQFQYKFGRNRKLPYFAAHAVGAEIFFCH